MKTRRLLVLAMALARGVAGANPVVVVPGSGPGLTPAALAARYAATPVIASGTTGRDTRIAVVAANDVLPDDVVTFRNRHGLPPAALDRLVVEGFAAPPISDPTMTVALEWAGALAPGAGLTAVVGDPWHGLAQAILDDLAPVIVLPAIDGDTPPDTTARALVRVLYDRHLVAVRRVLIELPGPLVAEVLFALAEQHGQTIVVPAGSPLEGRSGVITVGGTALDGTSEAAWDDAAGRTEPGGDVAALASPIAPGYAFDLLGTPRCCAGGTAVAAAVFGGVAALLDDASDRSVALASFVEDAGRRQGDGGIVAFTDVTAGVPPPAEGFDSLTGFGSPLVSGLVAALDCAHADCGGPDADACSHGICREGGVCERTPVADGTGCTVNACTIGATCQAGACTGGTAVTCSDAGACTSDACEPDEGCVHDPVGNGATCQLRAAGGDARRCGLDWLVEAGSGAAHGRRVICRDGDPACDHDDVVGQCTFHLSVCAPVVAACPRATLRAARPSPHEARRSRRAATARRALEAALGRAPAPGQCSEAAAVPVMAGARVTLRATGGRRATRPIRLACAGA